MDLANHTVWRQETWLMQNGVFRRPLKRDTLTRQEFDLQKEDDVEYTVYRRFTGTWSDGKGGRQGWRETRIK